MFNIIVFVTPWHSKMTIRDKEKITIKWNWCSNGSNSVISDHFDCFYNDLHHVDAQWQVAQNLSFPYAMAENN